MLFLQRGFLPSMRTCLVVLGGAAIVAAVATLLRRVSRSYPESPSRSQNGTRAVGAKTSRRETASSSSRSNSATREASPLSSGRTLTPTATFRQPPRGHPVTPPRDDPRYRGVEYAGGPLGDTKLEPYFERLPSQLDWCDAVLGVYIQYATLDIVLISEHRHSPTVSLRFATRHSAREEPTYGPLDVSVILEMTAPIWADRGGIGGGAPQPATSRLDGTHQWAESSYSPGNRPSVTAVKPLDLHEYVAGVAKSLELSPDVTVRNYHSGAEIDRVVVSPGPQMAVPSRLIQPINYGAVTYIRVIRSASPSSAVHGYMLIAAHPYISGLFITVRFESVKAVARPTVPPPFVKRIVHSIALIEPERSPSYVVLCEPKQGTGVRLPLVFGLHRTLPCWEPSSDDTESDDERRLTFAEAMRRAPRGSRVSAAASSAASTRPVAQCPQTVPTSQHSSVRPKLAAAKSRTVAHRRATGPPAQRTLRHGAWSQAITYAVLVCDDAVVYASYEPYLPGGSQRLGEVTSRCVERLSGELLLSPSVSCVLSDSPEPTPTSAPDPPNVMRAKRRRVDFGQNGDRCWWGPQLRAQITRAVRQGAPNVSMNLGNLVTADVCSAGLLNTHVRSSPASQNPSSAQRCRFAVFCAAVPTSKHDPNCATFWSFAVLSRRSVPRESFFDTIDTALHSVTLHNGRGQRPSLHYVGVRHNIRIALTRDLHVMEPVLADPALVLFRTAASSTNPPFLNNVDDAPGDVLASSGVHRRGDCSPTTPPPSPAIVPGAPAPPLDLPHVAAHPCRTANCAGTPHEHHGADWWRHLLPVVTLRTTAAPCKAELAQWLHVRPDAKVAYFDLWLQWAIAMAAASSQQQSGLAGGRTSSSRGRSAAASTSSRDGNPQPLGVAGFRPSEPVVTHQVERIAGMRAIVIAIHVEVAVERVRTPSTSASGDPSATRLNATASSAGNAPCSVPGWVDITGAIESQPQLQSTVTSLSILQSARFGGGELPHETTASIDAFIPSSLRAPQTSSLRLHRSGGGGTLAERHGKAEQGPLYNAFSIPHLEPLTHSAPNLSAALAAHAQAWRWAIAPDEGDSSSGDEGVDAAAAVRPLGASTPMLPSSSVQAHSSQKGSAPPTPMLVPSVVQPATLPSTADVAVCTEVRYIVAMLPPLWHQLAVHGRGIDTQPPPVGLEAEAADDEPNNEIIDRNTLVFQTQPLPSACAEAARVSLLGILRRVELLSP